MNLLSKLISIWKGETTIYLWYSRGFDYEGVFYLDTGKTHKQIAAER